MFDTELCTLYSGSSVVLGNLNQVPVVHGVIASNVPLDLQRGGRLTAESAYALGMDPQLSAVAFFNVSWLSTLQGARLLDDAYGQAWSIVSDVEFRPDDPQLSYCKVILRKEKVRPDMLPMVETVSVKTGLKVSEIDIKTP